MRKAYAKALRWGILIVLVLALCTFKQAAPEPVVSISPIRNLLTFLSWLHYSEPTTENEAATEAETECTTYPEIIANKNDPYSYVVRAYYAIAQNPGQYYEGELRAEELVQGFSMFPNGGFDTLYMMMYGNSQHDLFYALYDLDGNGRKELLLGAGDDYGTYLFDIYIIRNGAAEQQLSNATRYSGMSIFKNGTVKISGGKMGYYYDSYYRFKNGQIRHCMSLPFHERWISDEEGLAFDYFKSDSGDSRDEAEITKEEYDRLQHEYEGDGREVKISWTPLADYGM